MIIRPMSDLHLECDGMEPWYMPRIEGEKDMVLVLAGDITANHNQWKDKPSLDRYSPWIKDVCARHKAVIYIKGNHEDYCGHMEATEDHWKAMSRHIENLHFLNRDTVVIDGVRFLGCTLWTHLNPIGEGIALAMMNDFDFIWADGELFNTYRWRLEHDACMYFLETELAKDFDGETVIVTHHSPSFKSIVGERLLDPSNVCYANNLDRLMWYNPIKLWIHGHTHDSLNYTVGDEIQSTQVICNPRGYSDSRLNLDFNPLLTVEI